MASVAEFSGEIDATTKIDEETAEMAVEPELTQIINSLVANEDVVFKSQQRGEPDLTLTEKTQIALDLYNKSKSKFLLHFGRHLTRSQLKYFDQFCSEDLPDAIEVRSVRDMILEYLPVDDKRQSSIVKRRRYEALKQLIQGEFYFTDVEMKKRNPLLYEQLVGQYLTSGEKQFRDKYKHEDQGSLVKILMEGIERNKAEERLKMEQKMEDDFREESDDEEARSSSSSPEPEASTSRWGEFGEAATRPTVSQRFKLVASITEDERKLLRDEFVSTMYRSFIDGQDKDFDYKTVDFDSEFDDVSDCEHDAEDRYFDAEEPEIAMQSGDE